MSKICTTKAIISEYPLLVLPTLAMKIGLNEAIVLQQMHYWLSKNYHIRDNVRWIYNSYTQWQQQFPFWSISTIKRAILSLEHKRLVLSGNFNKLKIDKTKWYTVLYDNIPEININDSPEGQAELTDGSIWPIEEVNLSSPLPETTTETTTETIKKKECVKKTNASRSSKFIEPTIDEIQQYIIDKTYNVDATQFYHFYKAKNWYVGKNKMKCWQSALVTWNIRNKQAQGPKKETAQERLERIKRGDIHYD